jgi:isopentenyldiphosphate isomerase/intracellular septation protein A
MKTKDLLKKLLPGLFPLIVFIITDEIFDTSTSIIIAVFVGIIQAIWIFIKEKRFDYFVLVDTFLIILMGGISLLFDNDLFFKLKPGIVETILCIMLIFFALAPSHYVEMMMGHYGMNTKLDENSLKKLRNSFKFLSLIFIVHTILVFYSAFYMSKEAWAIISGVLFYIIFAIFFLYELFKNYINRKNTEWLPIVDKNGIILGKVSRNEAHKNKEWLHPVIHLHIFNDKGELFLQKRGKLKLVMPEKWDTSVGGHILWGESIEQTIKRETKEELGFNIENVSYVCKYVWESEIERELVYVFYSEWNNFIKINSKELDDGKFWSKQEIIKNLNRGIFTPNFEYEWKIISKLFNKKQRLTNFKF